MKELITPSKFKITNALLFGIFGVLLAMLVNSRNDLYYKYIDKTVYYSIESPARLDKRVYKACDKQMATLTVHSKISGTATNNRELVLERVSDQKEVVFRTETDVVVEVGDPRTVKVPLTLPCSLEIGEYAWRSSTEYYTPQGIRRFAGWTTEDFFIE